jgi:hypothetical protein
MAPALPTHILEGRAVEIVQTVSREDRRNLSTTQRRLCSPAGLVCTEHEDWGERENGQESESVCARDGIKEGEGSTAGTPFHPHAPVGAHHIHQAGPTHARRSHPVSPG